MGMVVVAWWWLKLPRSRSQVEATTKTAYDMRKNLSGKYGLQGAMEHDRSNDRVGEYSANKWANDIEYISMVTTVDDMTTTDTSKQRPTWHQQQQQLNKLPETLFEHLNGSMAQQPSPQAITLQITQNG